jgi:hypothetical protein
MVHLQQGLQKLVDRGDAAAVLGRQLQVPGEHVFVEWHPFRSGGGTRLWLQTRLDGPVRAPEMGFVTSALYSDLQKAEHRPGT